MYASRHVSTQAVADELNTLATRGDQSVAELFNLCLSRKDKPDEACGYWKTRNEWQCLNQLENEFWSTISWSLSEGAARPHPKWAHFYHLWGLIGMFALIPDSQQEVQHCLQFRNFSSGLGRGGVRKSSADEKNNEPSLSDDDEDAEECQAVYEPSAQVLAERRIRPALVRLLAHACFVFQDLHGVFVPDSIVALCKFVVTTSRQLGLLQPVERQPDATEEQELHPPNETAIVAMFSTALEQAGISWPFSTPDESVIEVATPTTLIERPGDVALELYRSASWRQKQAELVKAQEERRARWEAEAPIRAAQEAARSEAKTRRRRNSRKRKVEQFRADSATKKLRMGDAEIFRPFQDWLRGKRQNILYYVDQWSAAKAQKEQATTTTAKEQMLVGLQVDFDHTALKLTTNLRRWNLQTRFNVHEVVAAIGVTRNLWREKSNLLQNPPESPEGLRAAAADCCADFLSDIECAVRTTLQFPNIIAVA